MTSLRSFTLNFPEGNADNTAKVHDVTNIALSKNSQIISQTTHKQSFIKYLTLIGKIK